MRVLVLPRPHQHRASMAVVIAMRRKIHLLRRLAIILITGLPMMDTTIGLAMTSVSQSMDSKMVTPCFCIRYGRRIHIRYAIALGTASGKANIANRTLITTQCSKQCRRIRSHAVVGHLPAGVESIQNLIPGIVIPRLAIPLWGQSGARIVQRFQMVRAH